MTEPIVSVLLPVRDAERTLAAALRSVTRQTEERFECVVVDDGSADGSIEIARRFAAEDERFRVIERRAEGLVPALNAGLEACRGRFVARMDADDVMHRCRLAQQRDALEEDAGLAAVGCHVRLFPDGEVGDGMREYQAWLNGFRGEAELRRDAFVECPLAHPTWFGRRAWFEAHRYRDRGWPEDYDLFLRALARGDRLGVVPEPFLAWRVGPERLSRTHPSYAIERFVACKAHFLAEGFLAESDEYVLWGYGGTGRALRAALEAHGRRPSHIVEVHPGRLGQRIHGAEVIEPAALPALPRRPLLASVAGAEPRAEVRAALARMGFEEGTDFLSVA